MKRGFVLVFVLMFVVVGCGVSGDNDSDNDGLKGGQDVEATIDGSTMNEENKESEERTSEDSDSVVVEEVEKEETEAEESDEAESEEEPEPEFIIWENFTMEAVRDNNIIDDDGNRDHLVMLPPSYYETERSYPVVYYFHGYNETQDYLEHFHRMMTNRMNQGKLQEMIIIGVNYNNIYGGSFMQDSDVIGHWKAGFFDELMPHLEGKYRVISDRESRGLIGLSMGGYVVMDLGMKYPDVFNGVYAVCPAMLEDSMMDNFVGEVGDQHTTAYGTAFAPDVNDESMYLRPTFDGSAEDEAIIDLWRDGYMNHDKKIEEYLAKEYQLAGLAMEMPLNDFDHIRNGNLSLVKKFDNAGVVYDSIETNGQHTINATIFVDHGLTYLQKYLYPLERDLSIRQNIILDSVANHNTVNDDGRRPFLIYLPESYYENQEDYPVFYYLHGFGGSVNDFNVIMNRIRYTTTQGEIPEAIYVAVSYSGYIGGSFAENSDITGYWEDAIAIELVSYIDSRYRTIQEPAGRGLIGFSMGGYSVIKLGFNNPDVFGGFYAYGPGCLVDNELDDAMSTWYGADRFLNAYGSAFADHLVDQYDNLIPLMDGSEKDQILVDAWLNGFGSLDEKVEHYKKKEVQLLAIGLEVATNEYYPWIYSGTKTLHEILETEGVDHAYLETEGGHSISPRSVVEIALPFLFENMMGSEE